VLLNSLTFWGIVIASAIVYCTLDIGIRWYVHKKCNEVLLICQLNVKLIEIVEEIAELLREDVGRSDS
jgi:hypothetical protein